VAEMVFEYAVVLTGGIATGKSSVATMFKEDDFKVIDADKVAHQMLDLHHEEVANLFGESYVEEGRVNRKLLGGLIFSDAKEKLRLENLLHPLIYAEIERVSLEADEERYPYILDIPLFFETKRYPIEKSIVVYTPKVLQLERLMSRDGSSREEAQKRIDSQIDIDKKKHLGTYLIDNSQDKIHLQQEYDRVKKEILDYFKG
jgi:dephospho-CoA kinase